MTTDTELIEYLEARSQRRLRILGIILGLGLAIGGIAFAMKTAADSRHRADCEVQEYVNALGGGDEDC